MTIDEVVWRWSCDTLAAVIKGRTQHLLLRKTLLEAHLTDEQLEPLLGLVNAFLVQHPEQYLQAISVPPELHHLVLADIVLASDVLFKFYCESAPIAH